MRIKWGLFIILVLAVIGLFCAIPPVRVPAQEPTPTYPRPTWTPGAPATKTPVPTPTPVPPPDGALLELHLQFPNDWPWSTHHWQEVWTVVQWQDGFGEWHDVDGWRGQPDGVWLDEELTVFARKTWYVAKRDLGTGPFRWVAYTEGEGGEVIQAISEPFDLPERRGLVVIVEAVIE